MSRATLILSRWALVLAAATLRAIDPDAAAKTGLR